MSVPRIKFDGCDLAKQMGRVFAENLHDLAGKVDKGGNGYAPGFFHTSSMPHEGVHYYGDMWSRDVGRGIIELARLGFGAEAELTVNFALSGFNCGDHWGRVFNREDGSMYETDGNVLLLLGICQTWKANGKNKTVGKGYLQSVMPVFRWMERLMNECPYGYLLPCGSELSGNPDTPYTVYGVFANYGAKEAMSAFRDMAAFCGCGAEADYLAKMEGRLSQAILTCLTAKKRVSLTKEGCWMNGLDGRDGRPYEFSEWAGTSWPIYHWTRQLPFIFSYDRNVLRLPRDEFYETHRATYEYILDYMCQNEYFTKYGFVSNTGWTGTGGRHDDTMCGYGQGYMAQTALLMDDINAYTKLLEGVARLAYDGNIVKPLAFEFNPWVMHECFTYENYGRGLDHTFGVRSEGRPGLMDNPGDEGNLVQEAEIIKALLIVTGVEGTETKGLRIMPRLPWTWDEMSLWDFPVWDGENRSSLDFHITHSRWLRKCGFEINCTIPLENAEIRLGPFPLNARFEQAGNQYVETGKNGVWLTLKGLSGKNIEGEVEAL